MADSKLWDSFSEICVDAAAKKKKKTIRRKTIKLYIVSSMYNIKKI
jgi:hypothetical protein